MFRFCPPYEFTVIGFVYRLPSKEGLEEMTFGLTSPRL